MIIDSPQNKQKILDEFLKLAPIYGWGVDALSKAMNKANIEEKYLPLIFPNGIFDLTEIFVEDINSKMVAALSFTNLSEMKVREKIKLAIKIRLENNLLHKAAIQKLTEFFKNPKNGWQALKLSYKTADLIWYSIGDESTDFNFYTKRLILSKVYIRTLLFFVKDKSSNLDKTMEFLDLEINKVMKIQGLKMAAKKFCNKTSKMSEKICDLKKDLSVNSVSEFAKKLPFIRLFKKNT